MVNFFKILFFSLITNISVVLTVGESNIYTNIIVFIISTIMIFLFLYFIENMRLKYVSKDSDEILHPVTENTTILHLCNIEKHYGKKFNPRLVEKCDCGSTMFRIYNEDTEKGTYIQIICVKCNQKATGLEFNWKVKV